MLRRELLKAATFACRRPWTPNAAHPPSRPPCVVQLPDVLVQLGRLRGWEPPAISGVETVSASRRSGPAGGGSGHEVERRASRRTRVGGGSGVVGRVGRGVPAPCMPTCAARAMLCHAPPTRLPACQPTVVPCPGCRSAAEGEVRILRVQHGKAKAAVHVKQEQQA